MENEAQVIFFRKYVRELMINFFRMKEESPSVQFNALLPMAPKPKLAVAPISEEVSAEMIPSLGSQAGGGLAVHPQVSYPAPPVVGKIPVAVRQMPSAFSSANLSLAPRPISIPTPRNFQPSPQISEQKHSAALERINIIGLERLRNFIADPSVSMIECAGPGKPLLVTKSGMVQTTAVNLSNEEINKIMEDISNKTRIPIFPGIFKAALDNLIITAVISDFVGTRFIIQKIKTPPQTF